MAVGTSETHPLLRVPLKAKGLAKGKGHTAEGRQRNTLCCQLTNNGLSVVLLKAISSLQHFFSLSCYLLLFVSPLWFSLSLCELPVIQTQILSRVFQQCYTGLSRVYVTWRAVQPVLTCSTTPSTSPQVRTLKRCFVRLKDLRYLWYYLVRRPCGKILCCSIRYICPFFFKFQNFQKKNWGKNYSTKSLWHIIS